MNRYSAFGSRLLAVLILAIAPSLDLVAQERARDTARIAPVVVSATRAELSQRALPVAVTIITAAELKLRGITTVAEALRDVTSAYVAQSGSQGSQTSLFLRGGESKYVKVLVDGVPANDPGGFYDFGSLTTDNVERIEVVRGPASVVHGADAVTGVVHVITRRGSGPATVTVEGRVGSSPRRLPAGTASSSVQTGDFTADIAGASEAASFSAGIAHHETNGLYSLNNHYLSNVLSGRFHFEPRSGTDLRLSLRYADHRFNYPTNGGGTPGDVNANRSEDRTLIGVEVERRLSASTRAALTLNTSVNDGVTDDQMDSPTGSSTLIQDKTRRRGADLHVHWTATKAAVTAGLALEQQDHRQQLQARSSFGPFMSSFRAARRNTGAYGEVVVTPTSQLTATLGARMDDNEAFGVFATRRVGVSWRPIADTRLRGTFGNAFREPTFLENYSSGFATGNPDLEAERTSSWDVGVDQDLLSGRVSGSATYFSQQFTNMIDYDPSESCGFSYCNVAAATSKGIELEGRGRVQGPVWVTLGATLLKTEVIEPGFDQSSGGLYKRGESLIRRPDRKITGEVAYRGNDPLSLSLRVQAVGTRTDRDFRGFPSTPVVLPSYERFDVGADYALKPFRGARPALTLRIENLTDEEYENVFNFLTPRRTVAVGVRSAF